MTSIIKLLVGGLWLAATCSASAASLKIDTQSIPLLTISGMPFKDMNRNGSLDPYEDWRLTPKQRAADLVTRMTLEEKAGAMMHGTVPADNPAGYGTHYNHDVADQLILKGHINTFLTRLAGNPEVLAQENNLLQSAAERTRLGIPLTISTDPRNSFLYLIGASNTAGGFSKWPEMLGMAAIGDTRQVRNFGDIVRQEYRAVGIHESLSPQADLYTEPRWARGTGSFGENPQLARKLVKAFIEGMQKGDQGLISESVIAVVKHWVGYGAAKDGWDSHNAYGKYANFSGRDIAPHIIPFTGAFEAKVGSLMPAYSVLQDAYKDNKRLPETAMGFSKFLLQDLLRDKLHFDGVVLGDWLITSDCDSACTNGALAGTAPRVGGMPWGEEKLSEAQRYIKAINAGVDQLGGVMKGEYLVKAVLDGEVATARVDTSVQRILEQKFALGLFENPFVDAQKAATIVGNAAFQAQASTAQKKSLVLLQNKGSLPLKRGSKVYLYRIAPEVARQQGLQVTENPDEADVAIVRADTPYETLHPGYFFGSHQHEGSLAFTEGNKDYMALTEIAAKIPTIFTVYLDRPAILSNVLTKANSVVGNFGISDQSLIEALMADQFEAKLPFELPSSMAAVKAQQSDLPSDSHSPLFPIGFGLSH